MTANLDLNLLPLYRLQGQELPQIPGLLVMPPPKRAAHGREDERLIVYLSLSGNADFPSAEYRQILERAAQLFYRSSGSLTSAIRTVSQELNSSLLKRNLQATGKGEFYSGRLILGALRGTQFLFAQCGPTHVFHLTGVDTRQIHDEQAAGRGLGISQPMALYFAQVDLHPGDLLILCPNLPAGWEAALSGEKNTSFEIMRRKLASLSDGDLNTVLIKAQAGKGAMNLLKGIQTAEKYAPPIPKVTPEPSASTGAGISPQAPVSDLPQAASALPDNNPVPPAIPTSRVESARPANRFTRILAAGGEPASATSASSPELQLPGAGEVFPPTAQQAQAPAQAFRPPAEAPAGSALRPPGRTGLFVAPRRTSDFPEIKRTSTHSNKKLFGGLVRIIQGMRGGSRRVSGGMRKFLPNLLPAASDGSDAALPGATLFAVVIPVIIVAIAATVYIQYGRTAQYQQYYEMALTQASQARGQASPTEVRRTWDSTIFYLDLAEKNQQTQDSINLRQEAQTALDNLDGILRLDYRQAITGGLSLSVRVSQMATSNNDLYLLDASSGSIIRAYLTNNGYEVDSSFRCDPGQHTKIIVGALIDMEVLPASNYYDARLLAMDASGNLLYCGLTEDPAAATPVPPQLGWRSITAFSLDSDGQNLYVLDSAGNAVWKYSGKFGKFENLPSMFFGEQVPQNMITAIDLDANNADLYILFQDGHITSCPLLRYEGTPMRCTDPVTFVDTRPERKPSPKINDAIFTQMTFTSAPDPSLYLLEPLTRAIYRFSPRADSLELRGQFRATMEQSNTLFDGPATALTISSNRYAFFSIGNRVYFATDVP